MPVALAFAILGLAYATVELPGTNDTIALINSNRKLQQYRPIPIDASVILLSISDVEGGSNSECVKMVERAKQFRGRSINFFVTFYYADYNSDNVMDKLGYRDQSWDTSFKELTYDAVQRYQRGLTVSAKQQAHHTTLFMMFDGVLKLWQSELNEVHFTTQAFR